MKLVIVPRLVRENSQESHPKWRYFSRGTDRQHEKQRGRNLSMNIEVIQKQLYGKLLLPSSPQICKRNENKETVLKRVAEEVENSILG